MTPLPASPPRRVSAGPFAVRLAAICLGLLPVPASQAASTCAMDSIAHCATASDLIWAPSFEPALRGFAGDRQVGWLGRQNPLADVVLEVLGGAPDEVVPVADDLLRFSAVRHQSALERGAILIARDGLIAAIGVLHFNCATGCDRSYSLAILMAREDAGLAAQVRDWGEAQMALNRQSGLEDDLAVIGRVEILTRQD